MFMDSELGHPLEKDFSYNNNVANSDINIRLGFIRKVYGILCTQLTVTAVVAGIMLLFKTEIYGFIQFTPFVPIFTMVLGFVFLIAMFVYKRTFPLNFMLLFGFTISQAFIVGMIVISYSVHLVILAVFLTAIVMVCLSAYSLRSSHDFSGLGPVLFVGLFALILATPISFFLGSTVMETAIVAGGVVLFSLLIIYDTQRLMHHHSAEDYIVASIDLYMDCINLFVYILRLLKHFQQD